MILDKHNELRRKIAKGWQRGQPAAANMKKLRWNGELEDIAQRWADQCTFAHDRVRSKKDGTFVGQNGYSASGWRTSTLGNVQKSMRSVTQAWYDEVKKFRPKGLKNFR